jgi:hypothetical protein
MVSLAHDKELSARLVRLGEARAAQFSDSSLMAEQYWELFQSAAAVVGADGQRDAMGPESDSP